MIEKPEIIETARVLGYLPERRSGGRYWGGNCPVKHGSAGKRCYNIYEDTQSFYCFHCKAGGDSFELIKIAMNCDFKNAVFWAKEHGLVTGNGHDEASYLALRKLHKILTDAAKFFHENLKDISHLKNHYGLTKEIINQYLIGYAPNDKNVLKKVLMAKGHGIADIRKTGLLIKYDNSFFQGQYSFPYWHNGLVKYFIARRTQETPKWKEGKYEKLPVNDLIKKDFFYGEDSIRGKDIVYLTEGVTDCLAALQHGLPSISPVTVQFKKSDHPKLLSLVKGKKIYIIPDNEKNQAGFKGAQEALKFLKENGVDACIITLPRSESIEKIDLNEYLRHNGIEAFNRLVEEQAPPTIADLVCDVTHFISIEFPQKRKIINPWLNENTIDMIYGPRGIGKTMYAFGILCAATTGENFGPWQVETPVPSLYLDGEMAPQDTQSRLYRFPSLKNSNRQPLIIYSDAHMNHYGLPRANLLDADWRKAMKELLIAKGVKLWVADNLASLAPGIDENSKQEWDPINQWFLELRFAGITTLFLHHANKDGGQRGTSGREDNIDISVHLDWPKGYISGDGCKFVAKFKKARLEHKYLHLITDTEFELDTDEHENYFWTHRNLKAENRKSILEMLDQGIAQKNIAGTLGVDKGYVSRVKSQAIKDGYIGENGKLSQSGYVFIYGA